MKKQPACKKQHEFPLFDGATVSRFSRMGLVRQLMPLASGKTCRCDGLSVWSGWGMAGAVGQPSART
jgi:hypothetical protein